MSWPPPGVDLSLNDRLLEFAEAEETQADSAFDLTVAAGRLFDIRNKAGPESTSAALLADAEDLERRATDSGQFTAAMLAGKVAAEILLDRNQNAEALAHLKATRDAYSSIVRTGGAQERDNDSQLLALMGRAALNLGDLRNASAYFGEAIDEIEQDRYGVNAPYLQAAFLKTRAAIYTDAAGTAFQLGDYETMLARTELSKAHFTMRVRNATPIERDEAHLKRFGHISDEIRKLDPRGNGRAVSQSDQDRLDKMLAERRHLWDWLAIKRFAGANVAPKFALAALQGALAGNAAILYYYWLTRDILLVAGIDRDSAIVAPVKLKSNELECLDTAVNFVNSCFSQLAPEDEAEFEESISGCTALIPAKVRAVIEGKQRLFISPNRQLHLFPFHALPWQSGYLIESFAISYAPNLSALATGAQPARPSKILIAGVGEFPSSFGLNPLTAIEGELEGVAEAYLRAGLEPKDTVH
jgi:hypothetical protein